MPRILITDCGSTTTKALLFEHEKNVWSLIGQADAPTTVEPPVSNVTVGVTNAIRELEEVTHRKILSPLATDTLPFRPSEGKDGIDTFLSTSSAGGGLQMVVTGIAKHISAESGQRAALGAGAIVLDVISNDDGRNEFEHIELLRSLKPDILLMSGGTEGGASLQLLDMAELVRAAAPEPRFGASLRLPCIFAGNSQCAGEVKEVLSSIVDFHHVDNVRPSLSQENIFPARETIHELFLSHVMSHSPGYKDLLSWTALPIEPTPNAAGRMIEAYARRAEKQVLCVDIGGATTDIFSLCKDEDGSFVYNRSVSANLGMSYSAGYVLKEAGAEGIMRWLPFSLDRQELLHLLRNKMVRPTTIPQDKIDLIVEQSLAREALRLSLSHHRSLAIGIDKGNKKKNISSVFTQKTNRAPLLSLLSLDLIIGSGGVLSHAPTPMGAFAMILDGFQPEGVTEVAVDSLFMLPHLGMLSHLSEEGATQLLHSTCLVTLGSVLAPLFPSKTKAGQKLGSIAFEGENISIHSGTVFSLPQLKEREVEVTYTPLKAVNFGKGQGVSFSALCRGGKCGLVIDTRNRPLDGKGAVSVMQASQKALYENLGISF